MKYVIIALSIVSFLAGYYLSSQLQPGPSVRTVTTPATVKTVTQTKIVEVFPDGHTVEKVVVQTSDKVEASPQPTKPEYRAGIILPLADELKLPTVSASKRLFGNVWLETQFDIRHKEILLGGSIEF